MMVSTASELKVTSPAQSAAGLSWFPLPDAPCIKVLLRSRNTLNVEAELMERLSPTEQFAWFYWHFTFTQGQQVYYRDDGDIFVVRALDGFKWRPAGRINGPGHQFFYSWALEPLPVDEAILGQKPAFLQLYNFTGYRVLEAIETIEIESSSSQPSS